MTVVVQSTFSYCKSNFDQIVNHDDGLHIIGLVMKLVSIQVFECIEVSTVPASVRITRASLCVWFFFFFFQVWTLWLGMTWYLSPKSWKQLWELVGDWMTWAAPSVFLRQLRSVRYFKQTFWDTLWHWCGHCSVHLLTFLFVLVKTM